MRPRSTNYYKVPEEEFIEIVKVSISIADALRKCQATYSGTAYRTFIKRVKLLDLDISHFTGQAHLKGKRHNWSPQVPLEEVLVENSSRLLTGNYRKRIIKEGLLEYRCVACGITDTYNGLPIVLQFDHKNGKPFDNRIENLQLLCANCHSQTKTFAGRSKNNVGRSAIIREREGNSLRVYHAKVNKCKHCEQPTKSPDATYCIECFTKHRGVLETKYERKRKADWPPLNELLERIERGSFLQVGKELGVSDNAVRKHIRYEKQKLVVEKVFDNEQDDDRLFEVAKGKRVGHEQRFDSSGTH